MKISARNFIIWLSAVVTSSALHADLGKLASHPFMHNGYSRPYLVYTPRLLSSHPPIVFVLGGVGSSASSTAQELGWTEQADRNGFLVVFPEPLPTDPGKPFVKRVNTTFWEMQGSRKHLIGQRAPVDDDGYLMALLHQVLRTEPVDSRRVFLVGFSSAPAWFNYLPRDTPNSSPLLPRSPRHSWSLPRLWLDRWPFSISTEMTMNNFPVLR